jgi:PPM family protein phosphatase
MTATTLRAGSSTDLGRRQVNQDRIFVDDTRAVYVVADGMGGHRGGATAAEMAVSALSESPMLNSAALIAAVESANTAIFERSQSDPDLQGMGTTITAMALIQADGEDRLSIANVGDSRAYRMRAGELELLTEDHNIVSELVREGHISAVEARTHRQRSVLTRAVGVEPGVTVDILEVLPSTGDRYLLCSDGLTGEVDASQIAGIMRRYADPNEACRDLIRVALASGSKDNISAVIVDVFDDGGVALTASQHVDATPHIDSSEPPDLESVVTAPTSTSPTDLVEPPKPPKPRVLTIRTVLFAAVLGAIGAVAYWAVTRAPQTDIIAVTTTRPATTIPSTTQPAPVKTIQSPTIPIATTTPPSIIPDSGVAADSVAPTDTPPTTAA